MEKDINFESLSETLNVQINVLELLHDLVPYRDSFQFLTNTTRQAEFWYLIDDSLPSHIGLQVHAADASFPCSDRDFPPDTITPYFQGFWAALRASSSDSPLYFHNPMAITQITSSNLGEIMEKLGNWSKTDHGTWCVCDREFPEISLCLMCDAAIDEGRPWLFCHADDVRAAYLECDKLLNKIDKSIDTSSIHNDIRMFNIKTTDDFVKLAKGISASSTVPKFSLPPNLLDALSQLMNEACNFFNATRKNCPIVDKLDTWTKSRAENLDKQMQIPFEQRNAFVSTPQILQARSGLPADQPFEKYSLAEFLFSNPNEDVMPFPYVSGKAEIQSESSAPFCHAAFRKFVAGQLMASGYTETTDSAIDILADVSEIIVKKIAQDAIAIQKGSSASTKDIMIQALNTNGFDVQAMITNPHLPL